MTRSITAPTEVRLATRSSSLLMRSLLQAFDLGDELEVPVDGHVGIERRILGQVADAALHLERLLEDVEAGDLGGAGSGGQEAGQDAHGGRLAGAVAAQKAQDFALGNVEGDVVERDEVSVTLGQIADFDHLKDLTSSMKSLT